jgi:hypothetical protein
MRTNLVGGLAVSVLVALAPVRGAWGEGDEEELDSIRRKDADRSIQTKITKDDYVTVEGRYKSAQVKVESYRVVEVLRGDRPDEYNQALERRSAGRFTVAARFFKEALDKAGGKRWAVEYCNWGLAEALYEGGHYKGYKGRTFDYQSPAVYYAAVLKANPKSRFALEAASKRAICLAEAELLEQVEAAARDAEKIIKQYREDTAKTVDPSYRPAAERAESLVKLARAKMLEKKADPTKPPNYALALSEAQAARVKATRRNPDVYAEAVELILRMLVKGRQFADAKAEAQTEIDGYQRDSDPDRLAILPVAHTVVGRACFAMASELEANNRLSEAQREYSESRWHYLKVLVEFFDREECVAEAGYYAGLCYSKLKGAEADAADKAIQCWLRVKRSFPDSEYARRADEELRSTGYKEPTAAAGKAGEKKDGVPETTAEKTDAKVPLPPPPAKTTSKADVKQPPRRKP